LIGNITTGNGTNYSAILQADSTNQGFLPPRTNLTSNISTPAQGLMAYLTGSTNEGLYYYNSGSAIGWHKVLTNSGSQDISGSLNVTSFTASNATISGNVTVLGTASINTLVVNQTQLSTGSNQLGDAANDTQTLFGTVRIPTGSLTVSGALAVSSSQNSYFVGGGNVGIGTITPANLLPNGWGSGGYAFEILGPTNQSTGVFLRRGNFTGIGLDLWSNNSGGSSFIDNRYDSSGANGVNIRIRTSGTPRTVAVFDDEYGAKLGDWTNNRANAVRIEGDITFRSGGGVRTITGPLNTSLILNALPLNSNEGVVLQYAGTTGFLLNNSGNVLINTTTDAGFRLDVNGTARVSGLLTLSNGSYATAAIGWGAQIGLYYDASLGIVTNIGGVVASSVNGTRFNFDKVVGIGTFNMTNDASARLQINSTTQGFLAQI